MVETVRGSEFEGYDVYDGKGMRLFEEKVCRQLWEKGCVAMCMGSVYYKEELSKRQGLHTAPFLCFENCEQLTPVPLIFFCWWKQRLFLLTSVLVVQVIVFKCFVHC